MHSSLRPSSRSLVHSLRRQLATDTQQQKAYAHYQRPPRWWQRKRNPQESLQDRNVQVFWYGMAVAIGALGATYAAVPLYKVFCQVTGFGGTTQRVGTTSNSFLDTLSFLTSSSSSSGGKTHSSWTDQEAMERLASLKPVRNADLITIRMDTTVSDNMPWTFEPLTRDVSVVPGETALCFFRVTNHHPTQSITGVATYNVHPPKVGLHFSKVQCFCFEEQRIRPGETVDMPVLFFIDPEILEDPQVSYVRSVTLSYTFFVTDRDEED